MLGRAALFLNELGGRNGEVKAPLHNQLEEPGVIRSGLLLSQTSHFGWIGVCLRLGAFISAGRMIFAMIVFGGVDSAL